MCKYNILKLVPLTKANLLVTITRSFTGVGDISDPCDGIPAFVQLTDLQSSVHIYSPNFEGGRYANNMDCVWNLQVSIKKYSRIHSNPGDYL